jgi:Tol biopolymer transport system component/DNA-binding winged helix-turn-helix (wHTH) protein
MWRTELLRFAAFRLDSRQRCLFQGDQRVRLTPKAFDLLALLVERRGGLVTREEIVQALWPDTFVEDSNLTYQMSSLRKALEPGGADLIETVPKRGYRLTVPVIAETAPAGETRKRPYRQWAMVILGAATLSAMWLVPHEWPVSATPPRVSPLTSYPGSELDPSLSPDESQVAFIWNGGSGDEFRVYTQAVGASVPRRLSAGGTNEASPAWSPDGRYIAFLRELTASRSAVIVIPASGGVERKLSEIRCGIPRADRDIETRYGAFLDWRPDGRWLAVSEFNAHDSPPSETQGIMLISTVDGTTRRLTAPIPPAADIAPAFRGDGHYLVFVRRGSWSTSQLFGMSLRDDLQPSGTPVLLSSEAAVNSSPKWTPNNEILFLAGPALVPELRLRRMDPSSRKVSAMPFLTDTVLEISGVRPSRQLAGITFSYVRANRDENIWEVRREQRSDQVEPSAAPLIHSSRADVAPEFSPDGKRLAFDSDRSGTMEIWISDSDGANPIQVTRWGGLSGSGPNWSPDGKYISYARRDQYGRASNLYLISADGGDVRQITKGQSLNTVPTWSNDGRSLYFTSNRGGSIALWKMPVDGGPAKRISDRREALARESPDGRWLYSEWNSAPGRLELVRRSLFGAGSVEILAEVANARSYAIADDGVYFISPPEQGNEGRIQFLRNDGRRATIATLSKPPTFGLSVWPKSAGSKCRIVYSQTDRFETDLMLVEGFR